MTGSLATVRLVAERELRERLRSKAFRVLTLVLALLIAVGSVLPALLRDNSPTRLAAVGAAGAQLAEATRVVASTAGDTVRIDQLPEAEARTRLQDGSVDAVLLGPSTVLVTSSLDATLQREIDTARRQLALQAALGRAGVPPAEQARLLAVPDLSVQRLQADDSLQFTAKVAVGLAAAGLLYGLLIFYGNFVAQGMVQEKQSRVIEVLLSVVRPVPLLVGKVVGLGLLGLLQVALLAVVAAVALTVSGTFDVFSQGLGVLGVVLAWYVLGFALYATLFALAGSVVSRVEDLQTTVTPVIVLLVGSLYLVQFSISQPSSVAATVAAVLPFSAPLAQPVRAAAGVGSAWQVVAAVGLTLLLLTVLVPVAARLYSGAALVTRGRASYRASLKRSGR